MSHRFFGLFIIFICLNFSCSREEHSFYAEDVPTVGRGGEYADNLNYLTDIGNININVIANANYKGETNHAFLKNISGTNHSYCHPDVLYFPDGFRGYRYWMVFTPYFGAVGTSQDAKRYENPTLVVSNDGLNWISPVGIKSPLQETPSLKESFIDQKTEPKQGFWSDVDWVYANNKFSLYSRASFVTAEGLKRRGAKSLNNKEKLVKNAQRTIVRQVSVDGINWKPLDVAFTSNSPYTPKNNHLLSPSFIHDGSEFKSYEIELNTGAKNFKGKDKSFVIQRTSADGLNFTPFNRSKIVNFLSKPWEQVDAKYSPWHIHAEYVDGFYFLCLAVGDVTRYNCEALYVAYSKDGVNFQVFPRPLVERNAYRSALFKMKSDENVINFGAVIGLKSGEFKYREFMLSKAKLSKSLE